jgi:hypothetical protein
MIYLFCLSPRQKLLSHDFMGIIVVKAVDVPCLVAELHVRKLLMTKMT